MELTLEEKQARVRDLRPIDDVFFEVIASDTLVCEEILRTILEDGKLTVQNVIVIWLVKAVQVTLVMFTITINV